MNRIAKLLSLAIVLMATLAPSIMAAPVSAPPKADLGPDVGRLSTAPALPGSVPCSTDASNGSLILVPPATSLSVQEQDPEGEDDGGERTLLTCKVGATVTITEDEETGDIKAKSVRQRAPRSQSCVLWATPV